MFVRPYRETDKAVLFFELWVVASGLARHRTTDYDNAVVGLSMCAIGGIAGQISILAYDGLSASGLGGSLRVPLPSPAEQT